jgi:hypothetical protein
MSEQQLDAESINAVAELAKESVRFPMDLKKVEREPDDVYFVINEKTGEAIRRVAEPAPKRMEVFDTSSIIELAKKPDAQILYSTEIIQVRHSEQSPDAFTRVLTHVMKLPRTAPFSALLTIEGKQFGQRPFWNLLRTVFFEGLTADQIAIFKNVRWSEGGNVQQQVGHVKESLGKSYTSDVIGEGAIPEYLNLSVPVFDNREVRQRRYPVLCAVDCDPQTQSFRLVPVAGALSRALDEALEDLMHPIFEADLKDVSILRAS